MNYCKIAKKISQNLKPFFAGCISLGVLCLSSCYQKKDSQVLETRTFDIEASTLRFDENKEAKYILNIKNPFLFTLEVLGIEKSCSCSRIDATNFSVQPNEIYDLPLYIRSDNSYGDKSLYVSLIFKNDIKWRYKIAFSQSPVIGFNKKIIEIGAIDIGGTDENFNIIISPDSEGKVPENIIVRSTSPLVQINKTGEEVNSGEKNDLRKLFYHIKIQNAPYSGSQMAYINASYTYQNRTEVAVLPISWSFDPPIFSSPSRIFISRDDGATKNLTRKIMIKGRDNKKFRIKNLKFNSNKYTFKWGADQNNEVHTLQFQINPAVFDRDCVDDLIVITDLDNAPELLVPIVVINN